MASIDTQFDRLCERSLFCIWRWPYSGVYTLYVCFFVSLFFFLNGSADLLFSDENECIVLFFCSCMKTSSVILSTGKVLFYSYAVKYIDIKALLKEVVIKKGKYPLFVHVLNMWFCFLSSSVIESIHFPWSKSFCLWPRRWQVIVTLNCCICYVSALFPHSIKYYGIVLFYFNLEYIYKSQVFGLLL